MNGIHEVTGSTPVWSTNFTRWRSFVGGPSGRQADRLRLRLAWIGTTPVWSTNLRSRMHAEVARRSLGEGGPFLS